MKTIIILSLLYVIEAQRPHITCDAFTEEFDCDSSNACQWYSSFQECRCISAANIDILFGIDTSGSIGWDGFQIQKQFVDDVIRQGLNNYPRIGFTMFSTEVNKSRSIQFWNAQMLEDYTAGIYWQRGWSNTPELISESLTTFAVAKKEEPDRQQIFLIISSDAACLPSALGGCPQSVCDKKYLLDHAGIRTIIVGVNTIYDYPAYLNCLSQKSEDILPVASYSTEDFNGIMGSLLGVLCPATVVSVNCKVTEIKAMRRPNTWNQPGDGRVTRFIEIYNGGFDFNLQELRLEGLVVMDAGPDIQVTQGQYIVFYDAANLPVTNYGSGEGPSIPSCHDCGTDCNLATCGVAGQGTDSYCFCDNSIYIACGNTPDGDSCPANAQSLYDRSIPSNNATNGCNVCYFNNNMNRTNWNIKIMDNGAGAKLIDEVIYGDQGFWIEINDEHSYDLISKSFSNDVGDNWAQSCSKFGTPGANPVSGCIGYPSISPTIFSSKITTIPSDTIWLDTVSISEYKPTTTVGDYWYWPEYNAEINDDLGSHISYLPITGNPPVWGWWGRYTEYTHDPARSMSRIFECGSYGTAVIDIDLYLCIDTSGGRPAGYRTTIYFKRYASSEGQLVIDARYNQNDTDVSWSTSGNGNGAPGTNCSANIHKAHIKDTFTVHGPGDLFTITINWVTNGANVNETYHVAAFNNLQIACLQIPSQTPTSHPTLHTLSPSQNPTTYPTLEPTQEPTVSPTNPTLEPTQEPTVSPTNPSTQPTIYPSNSQTLKPGKTHNPTTGPSNDLIGVPTYDSTSDNSLILTIVILIVILFMVICVMCFFMFKFKQNMDRDKHEIKPYDKEIEDLQIADMAPMETLIEEEEKQHVGMVQETHEIDDGTGKSDSEELYVKMLVNNQTQMEIEMVKSNILGIENRVNSGYESLKSWFNYEVNIPNCNDIYYQLFIDNGYDTLEIVQLLNEDKLRKINITKLGHIDKIMMEVNNLKQRAQYNEIEGIERADNMHVDSSLPLANDPNTQYVD